MPKPFKPQKINRILDANINRIKEGLRVSEEIARFILDDPGLTRELKRARHSINRAVECLPGSKRLLLERDSEKDVGKEIYAGELKRKGISDIFFANMQRSKESLRVLEEFSKLLDKKAAVSFKKIRYALYEIEKRAAKKVAALSDPG
ncbi:MAG: thiamine-phosphate pyrophosphorylase [Candidatus Omnitrophica bacterium]|nr:thiamine-phosphate pyrophosphorylase [Candidatus Omnitrophota bacterium]